MSINILMPALSPTMTEGKLAKWHVKEGDAITSGQVICEIETDKPTMEVEAVDEGKVGRIVVAEGAEGVKVNAVIAILLEEGEKDVPKEAAAPTAAQAAAREVHRELACVRPQSNRSSRSSNSRARAVSTTQPHASATSSAAFTSDPLPCAYTKNRRRSFPARRFPSPRFNTMLVPARSI